MFRRPFGLIGRPLLRRPRVIRAALLGGTAFALGRRNRPAAPSPAPGMPLSDGERRLAALEDLHDAGALTGAEYEAARHRLESPGE